MAPPLLSLLPMQVINALEDVARDPRLNDKLREKREIVSNMLKPFGFERFASGTNRLVYKYLENQSILLKVAISNAGLKDSPAEYQNQFKLAPYVAKCFETSPGGALGLFERVNNITSVEEFYSISDSIFNLIDSMIGKYVLADIGTNFFMNWGIRNGFGAVLLDYPLLYELDGAKLYCNVTDPFTGIPCGGPIDYDDGFNFLYCKRCGKQYLAKKLAKGSYGEKIIFKKKENTTMKIEILRGNNVIATTDNTVGSDYYAKGIKRKKLEEASKESSVKVGSLQAEVIRGGEHLAYPVNNYINLQESKSDTKKPGIKVEIIRGSKDSEREKELLDAALHSIGIKIEESDACESHETDTNETEYQELEQPSNEVENNDSVDENEDNSSNEEDLEEKEVKVQKRKVSAPYPDMNSSNMLMNMEDYESMPKQKIRKKSKVNIVDRKGKKRNAYDDEFNKY